MKKILLVVLTSVSLYNATESKLTEEQTKNLDNSLLDIARLDWNTIGPVQRKEAIENAKKLLKAGANQNAQGPSKEILPIEGRTALMEATHMNNKELIEILLKKGAMPNIQDELGRSALESATDPEIVKILLDHGAQPNRLDRSENTPLLNAIATADIRIIRLLLEHGANVNYKNIQHGGATPLMLATWFGSLRGYKEIIKLLLDRGADVTTKNSIGLTALDIARSELSKNPDDKAYQEVVAILEKAKKERTK